MTPNTKVEKFIFDEVGPQLEADEAVEQCAYFTTRITGGPVGMAGARAYFFALTNRRLFVIETSVGAFRPLLEGENCVSYPLSDIAGVHVGDTVILQFAGDQVLELKRDERTRHVLTQKTFLERLVRDYGDTEVARDLARENAAFDESLRSLTPRLIFTPGLVAINAAVFLAMIANGVHPMKPTIKHLIAWGSNYGPQTADGEYWRLLTCTFIHIGVLHILFNMYVLWDVGRLVERLVGNTGFIALYLISGLLGSIASVWYNPMVVSAGASGAVFGVAGALLAIVVKDRGAIPKRRLAKLRSGVGAFVFYNFVFGLGVSNIDQAAHFGGLAAGFLCGLVLARSASEEGLAHRLRRSLVVALLGAATIAGLVFQLPTDVADAGRTLDEFATVEGRVIDTFNSALKRNAKGAELAAIIEREMLPDWRISHRKLAELEGLPKAYQQRIDLLERYAELREQQWVMFALSLRTDDAALAEAAQAKGKKAEAIIEQLRNLNK